MHGFINFIRSLSDAFKTAFGKGTKKKSTKRTRPRQRPVCDDCAEPLEPEQFQNRRCDDCLEKKLRESKQDA